MTREQINNKQKSERVKELKKNLTVKEFNELYVGHYRGHIRKIRSVFNSTKFGCKNHGQADKALTSKIFSAKE
jgi:hypothetical protein